MNKPSPSKQNLLNYQLEYELFDKPSDLAEDEQELLKSALESTNTAHAPYSEFLVGAALLTSEGSVICGSNQENHAFPSGMCAERTALFAAGSSPGDGKVLKLAVRAKCVKNPVRTPQAPCGACRQSMLEYEKLSGVPMVVLMQGESGPVMRIEGVANNLLPWSFDFEF